MVSEGQSFLLRCLGWKHRNVFKVIYYRNGIPLKYWYENYNMSIANTTEKDSGSYHCGGTTWQINHTSEPLWVTVRKGQCVTDTGQLRRGRGDPPRLAEGRPRCLGAGRALKWGDLGFSSPLRRCLRRFYESHTCPRSGIPREAAVAPGATSYLGRATCRSL